MSDHLNDSLDDLIGSSITTPKQPPANYKPVEQRAFTEACPKCRGTGHWRPGYPCFKCKGTGRLTFKTSREDRAQSRAGAATRRAKAKDKRAQDLAAQVEAFKIAEPAIWSWLDGNDFGFAQAMRAALARYGSLTDGQMAACRKCVAANDARKSAAAARIEAAPAVDVSKIEKAFAVAREKAHRARQVGMWLKPLRLQSGEHALSFRPGSDGSEWAGMIFVKTENGQKLGHVKAGKFIRRFECTDAQEAAVLDACSDPAKAAVAYGKAWSICAVCARTLTNDESIERGIGPVCAERFGW